MAWSFKLFKNASNNLKEYRNTVPEILFEFFNFSCIFIDLTSIGIPDFCIADFWEAIAPGS